MTAPPRITSFLVKIASRCNLDCDYCYVYHHADQSWRTLPRFLSAADEQCFVGRLSEYVASAGISRCLIIFHGGEPLLAGVDRIVKFAAGVRAALAGTAEIDFGLQTNGLLLTDEALQALATANIGVSLSLDGPKHANDLHRKSRKGRSSFHQVEAALGRLKHYPNIFSGVIAVIDPSVPAEELLTYFDKHAPPQLDLLLPDAHHLRPPIGRDANPELYERWLIDAFDAWFDKFAHLPVRTFDALLDAVAGLPSGTDAFGLGDVSLITIETDGSYHDLDVLKIAGETHTRLEGTVRDTAIADVAASATVARHRHLLRAEGTAASCQACRELATCGGGALPHRYGANGFANPSVYCREMLGLIGHVRRRMAGGLARDASSYPPLPADLPAVEFEDAERSGIHIARLWSDAEANHLGEMRKALLGLRQQRSHLSAPIDDLLARPDDQLSWLAALPGSVAWLRVMNAASNALFAVDGSPLTRDPDYVRFLASKPRDGVIAIAEEDPWLRKPFGTSIAFETSEIAALARPLTRKALALVEEWSPALAREMRKICSAIQFVRDPSAHPDKIVSFSDDAVPGALFVSVMQGDSLIDPYDLADSLIHEHRHQKLYLLERLYPMIEDTRMSVPSPWREDPRPPSGLMHALFVFTELRRFWTHVRCHGPARLHNRASNQLRETDDRLERGFRTLRDCPLTPAGREVAAALERGHETARQIA